MYLLIMVMIFKLFLFFLTQQSLQRHTVVHDPERKKQVTMDHSFVEICFSCDDVMLSQ